jgi:hypothetical protein
LLVSRLRIAYVAGTLLLVAACALPCASFAELSGASIPYQDPTPEMVQKQAAETAALEHQLVMRAWIGGALASAGLVALIYARRHRRRVVT